MSVTGGGNLYPNWLGSASLTIPNNQVVVNGNIVNVVPYVTLTNQTITTITKNTTTLLYQTPPLPPGKYFVGGETQTGNQSSTWLDTDCVDWVFAGVGETSADYAEVTVRPYFSGVVLTAGGGAVGTGITKIDCIGITELTATRPIGVYVTYYTTGSGTVSETFSLANFFYQKIA